MTDHEAPKVQDTLTYDKANAASGDYFKKAGYTAETFENVTETSVVESAPLTPEAIEKRRLNIGEYLELKREQIAQKLRNLQFLRDVELRDILRPVGALSVAALSVTALAACAQETPHATESAPAGPELELPEVGPLSVEKYPNAAALAPAFINAESNWNNAGATPDNAALSNADASGKVRTEILTKTDKNYRDTLIIAGALDPNTTLGKWVADQEGVHAQTVGFNFLNVKFKQKVPYVRDVAVVPGSVVPIVENDKVITAKMEVVESDNADPANNNVLEYTKGVKLDTTPEAIQFTWNNVKGQWELSDVTHL